MTGEEEERARGRGRRECACAGPPGWVSWLWWTDRFGRAWCCVCVSVLCECVCVCCVCALRPGRGGQVMRYISDGNWEFVAVLDSPPSEVRAVESGLLLLFILLYNYII